MQDDIDELKTKLDDIKEHRNGLEVCLGKHAFKNEVS